MNTCPSCGRENPPDWRFRNACGTQLTSSDVLRKQRKLVTVLFCDLVGSTSLG